MAIKKVHIGPKPADVQYNVTAKVGTTADKPTDADRGKPFKLAGDSTYVRCVDGDPIEAVLTALTVAPADGVTVGTVKTNGYLEVIVVGTAWAIGDEVVAAAQAANGIYNDAAQFFRAKVKKATAAGTHHRWRIVSVIGSPATIGTNNAAAVIERLF